MSSNSWARPAAGGAGGASPETPVRTLTERAIEILAVELPPGFERLCRVGAGTGVLVEIDDERFTIAFPDRGPVDVTDPAPATATVLVRVPRTVVALLVEGRTTVLEAVIDRRLTVVGPLDDVRRLWSILMAFVDAAMRCPSMPALRAELDGNRPDRPT